MCVMQACLTNKLFGHLMRAIVGINFVWIAIDASFAAEIRYYEDVINIYGEKFYTNGVSISGQIGEGDAKTLVREIERFIDRQGNEIREDGYPSLGVVINSRGGKLTEAISMGYVLRKYYARVHIGKEDVCISSCVFLLAGGVYRFVEGRVGIHRPYFEAGSIDGPTQEKVKTNFNYIMSEIYKFSKKMNISSRLIEDMVMIPSEKVRFLNKKDLLLYGISQKDPIYDETISLKEAKRYKITREQYMRRRSRVNKECTLTTEELFSTTEYHNVLNCREDVMTGKR